jgi:hypothetical protein
MLTAIPAATVVSMSEHSHRNVISWWALLAAGTAVTLLVFWLSRVAGVPLSALLWAVAGVVALAWLIVLVAAPWNLYFAARNVAAGMAASQRRGIVITEAQRAEPERIARRMLWFALGGHAASALASAAVAYVTGDPIGYYFGGFYLLSATLRPAFAYFSHLRERISALSRESRYPREDIVSLRDRVTELSDQVGHLSAALPRVQAGFAEDISHTREMQDRDRETARSRDEAINRRIDRMVRQIEDTLNGISDHQELQAGIRALVRMIKADAVG